MLAKKYYQNLFKPYFREINNGNFKSAQKRLAEIIKCFPSKGWYHQGLLISLMNKNKGSDHNTLKQKIFCFKKSLKYDSKNPAAWRALGNALFSLKKYKESESAYKKSLKYSKSALYKNDAMRFLADTAIAKKQYKKAENLLDKILKSKHRPPYFQIAYHYIKLYQKTGRQDLVNFWAQKGITSLKIVEKSGKKAYGPQNAYQKLQKLFLGYIK
ncbi:MAG: hypothetical protein PHC85_00575 [Candidatus Pacebacteria bacterium]|nr:hypothetical protein [Candidatus Paceibacterota bacterium]